MLAFLPLWPGTPEVWLVLAILDTLEDLFLVVESVVCFVVIVFVVDDILVVCLVVDSREVRAALKQNVLANFYI